MSYKQIDHKRLTYLLLHGLDQNKVLGFFKENRIMLIQAGVKVQNIPKTHQEQISLIVSKFTEKAYKIFEKFVINHLSGIEVKGVGELVSAFSEKEKTSVLDDEAEDNCKSALYHLFNDDTPIELLEFLRTRIDNNILADNTIEKIERVVIPEYIPDLILAAYGIHDDKNSHDFPEYLVNFLKALSQLSQGKKIDSFKNDFDGYPTLLEALNRAESARNLASLDFKLARGLKYFDDEGLSDISSINISELEVVGHCLNVAHDKDISFIEPIGLMINNTFVRLAKEQWEKLFPNIGQLIAFSDTTGLRLPNKGDLGVWRVEEYPTERPIKTRLRSLSRQVFEVFSLGFPSDDFDSVRSAINDFKIKLSYRPLFLLSDGIIVRPKYDIGNHSQDNFDEPLEAWLKLKAFRLGTKSFVMGPLPTSDFSYDCSDFDKFLSNLVKYEQELKVIPQLTKTQTINLLTALKDAAKNVDLNRTNQLNTKLDRILRAEGAVQKAMDSILNHPVIVAELNIIKEQVEQRLLTEKSTLHSEIESLKKFKSDLDKSIKLQQSERNKLPAEFKKQTLLAFEDARNQGVKAWANSVVMMTLFEALTESKQPDFQVMSRSSNNQYHIPLMAPKNFNIEELLIKTGATRKIAKAINLSIDVARAAGLGIIFSGTAASVIAKAYSRNTSKKNVCMLNIPVGLVDSSQINICLESSSNLDVLLLNNYNLSAIEAYGPQIISIIEDSLLGVESFNHLHIIATRTSSVAALPISDNFERLSLVIDLDRKSYTDEDSVELFKDIIEEADQVSENKRHCKVAVASIISALADFKEEEKKMAIPILIAGTLNR